MGEKLILERIAVWEAAGLIDAATAERLRGEEADRSRPALGRLPESSRDVPAGSPWRLGLGELFGYIGGGFMLAAYHWLIQNVTEHAENRDALLGLGTAAAALVAFVAGMAFRNAANARVRAAGLLVLVGEGHAAVAAYLISGAALGDDATSRVAVSSLAWILVAALGRSLVRTIPTQLGLVAAIAIGGGTLLGPLERAVIGAVEHGVDGASGPITQLAVGRLVWAWLLSATLITLGRYEARSTRDASAVHRAALARAGGGLTATFGTAFATSAQAGVEPFPTMVDVLLLLGVAALLAFLALRSGAVAFIYTAGLAAIIGLSTFNADLASGNLGLGLLIEGVILLAIGYLVAQGRRLVTGLPSAPSA